MWNFKAYNDFTWKSLHTSQGAFQGCGYICFFMEQPGVFLLPPLNGILVHRRVTPSSNFCILAGEQQRIRVSSSKVVSKQHKNFYYFYLYACKTEVFIIIYSSIETTFASTGLTFGCDQARWNELSIETTFDRTDSIPQQHIKKK